MYPLAADIGTISCGLARVGDAGVRTGGHQALEYADLHQLIERFVRDLGGRGAKISKVIRARPDPTDPDCMQLADSHSPIEHRRLVRDSSAADLLLNVLQVMAGVFSCHASTFHLAHGIERKITSFHPDRKRSRTRPFPVRFPLTERHSIGPQWAIQTPRGSV